MPAPPSEHSGESVPALAPTPRRISWLGIGILNFVWFCEVYSALLLGVGLTFVVRRFTADTRLIALVSTTGMLFRGTIGPLINYLSDRLWTRWGRRRPFIIAAYALSALGLFLIPLAGSLTTLVVAVACHAFVLSFASPMEPLYMETVPAQQQGRSQAIRTCLVDASVLYFFQISLVQFELGSRRPAAAFSWSTPVSGIHLAFWLGSALFGLIAFYLAIGTRETNPYPGRTEAVPLPRLWALLRSFPRDVFADWRWWPIYGLYVAPGLGSAVWGSFQSLMLVEQFGYDMTSMARLGLPVSIAGIVAIAPLMGVGLDRGLRLPWWQLLGTLLLLLGLAGLGFRALPLDSRELPPLGTSLFFCLSLGLAGVCFTLLVVFLLGRHSDRFCRRSCFVLVSAGGQIVLALAAGIAAPHFANSSHVLGAPLWLAYLTISQVTGLAATVALMPLLFSKISSSKFGTVSSGFGVFGSAVTYLLGNLGGVWVHGWTQFHGSSTNQYSCLWPLQALLAGLALFMTLGCLRSPILKTNPSAESR